MEQTIESVSASDFAPIPAEVKLGRVKALSFDPDTNQAIDFIWELPTDIVLTENVEVVLAYSIGTATTGSIILNLNYEVVDDGGDTTPGGDTNSFSNTLTDVAQETRFTTIFTVPYTDLTATTNSIRFTLSRDAVTDTEGANFYLEAITVKYVGFGAPVVWSGISGQSGWSGVSGQIGSTGSQGISGWSGWSGTSGTSGWSGTSGTSGWSGTSGFSGATLLSGYSGFSGASSSALTISNSAPGSPAVNDLWFETTSNIMWFWNGSRWLSTQRYEFVASTGGIGIVSTQYDYHAIEIDRAVQYDIYIEHVVASMYAMGTNNGTHYWIVSLYRVSAANVSTLISTSFNTSADAADTWLMKKSSAINTLLDMSAIDAKTLNFRFSTNNSPSALIAEAKAIYRLAHL